MKKIVVILALLWILSASACSVQTDASEKIAINEKNFPNQFLREELSEFHDPNDDGFLSQKEIKEITWLDMNLQEIGEEHEEGCNACVQETDPEKWRKYDEFDCAGLKYLTNLKELSIRLYGDFWNLGIESKIENIEEINELKNLESLSVYFDETIETLDISGLKKLKTLSVNFEKLENIKITNCKKLKKVYVSSDELETVEFEKLPKLKVLSINAPKMEKINLKKFPKLKYFGFDGEELKRVNLSKNTNIEELWINSLKLEKVVFPKENNIFRVVVRETPIAKLNLKRLNAETLRFLNIGNTEIMEVDVSRFTNMKRLQVNDDTVVTKADGQKTKVDRNGERFSDWYVNFYLVYRTN